MSLLKNFQIRNTENGHREQRTISAHTEENDGPDCSAHRVLFVGIVCARCGLSREPILEVFGLKIPSQFQNRLWKRWNF